MQNLSSLEVNEICKQLGEYSPIKIQRVYGGNIHSTWQIEFVNSKFFLKKNQSKERYLKFEKNCLNNLKKYISNENLIIPKVVSYIEVNNIELLLMEWINMSNSCQENLGKGLGEMHIASNSENPGKFGYPIKGYIGTSEQIKGWEGNWIDCFINLRIEPQLAKFNSNFISKDVKNKLNKQIKSVLNRHKPFNCLIHGDLWTGNVGTNEKNKGVIFDPACWWADNEMDIAMTKLFGSFKNEFYEEYHKVIPKKETFEKRITIYNFYHVLNHANMFGGSYLHLVEDYIKEIILM